MVRLAIQVVSNTADEYINHIVRFGHWKDIVGIRLDGQAVKARPAPIIGRRVKLRILISII